MLVYFLLYLNTGYIETTIRFYTDELDTEGLNMFNIFKVQAKNGGLHAQCCQVEQRKAAQKLLQRRSFVLLSGSVQRTVSNMPVTSY